ncbi:MAG TPA: carboxypeptidase regulatory-like domain-containing protein [Gemmatimonadaceae bacterium]
MDVAVYCCHRTHALGVAALLIPSLAVAASAQRAAGRQADSAATLIGIVTMNDGALPLPFSTVSIPALGRELFSNDRGIFTLAGLPAAPLRLRVRHLGYSPVELTVDVHPGQTDTVHVTLTHIAVRLGAVNVRAYPECKTPGPPIAPTDSAFATVFDQLRQNAEQYRLLTRTYPYVYSIERTLSTTLANGEVRFDGVDTTTFNSASDWKYIPGGVITRQTGSRLIARGGMMKQLPTLAQFADTAFIDNHCFYNGGTESLDGTDLLRVDFIAASRITDPDVNGAMYLDPATFQIRRAVLHLSRIPTRVVGLAELEAVTYFGEVLSSIPIIAGVMSVNRFVADNRRPQAPLEAHEDLRLLSVRFLRGRPGDELKKP